MSTSPAMNGCPRPSGDEQSHVRETYAAAVRHGLLHNEEGASPCAESAQLTAIEARLESLCSAMEALTREVGNAEARERVLAELHDRNSCLQEQRHEQETLVPIVLGLIGIADRTRQLIGKAGEALALVPAGCRRPRTLAIRQLQAARRADLAEIESLIAQLAVERVEAPGQLFDPSTQRCLTVIATTDPERDGLIGTRLQPAYRRYDRLIRHELVSVLSYRPPSNWKGDSA